MSLSEMDIRRQIRRLLVVYSTSKQEDQIVEAWKWVLGDLAPAELMAAVSEYAKSAARYFPTPGQLLEIAKVHAPPATAGNDTESDCDAPCPTCGAVIQLTAMYPGAETIYDKGKWRERTKEDPPAPKRYFPVHDRAAHLRAGTPIVGVSR